MYLSPILLQTKKKEEKEFQIQHPSLKIRIRDYDCDCNIWNEYKIYLSSILLQIKKKKKERKRVSNPTSIFKNSNTRSWFCRKGINSQRLTTLLLTIHPKNQSYRDSKRKIWEIPLKDCNCNLPATEKRKGNDIKHVHDRKESRENSRDTVKTREN